MTSPALSWCCPFCNRQIILADVSDARAKAAGLVYVRLRCVPCNATIDAAGRGWCDAKEQLGNAVKRRIGTRPEDWRIQTRGERTRRTR